MVELATSDLLVTRRGAIVEVTFNRPHARNALTWEMYDGLVDVCDDIEADATVRTLVLKGAGDQAFVAGTDITQFDGFDGAAGVAYEARIGAVLARVLALRIPVVASVRGSCVGGGLAIAACADVRVASPDARFGVPIARTLGNTLSTSSLRLLTSVFGHSRVASMLITGRLLDADEATVAGFLTTVDDDPDVAADALADRLSAHAPLTIWATKELLRRQASAVADTFDDDVVARVYGSADFAGAVAAFSRRERPVWSGA